MVVITALICLSLLSGCGASRNSQPNPPLPITLQTEDYPKQIGYEAVDSSSSGNKTRVSFSKIGLISWGQYLPLPAGKYTAEYRIKIGEMPAGKKPLVAVSVTSGGVTNVGVTKDLAIKILTAKQLVPLYRYKTIPLQFSTQGDIDFEFRVQVLDPDVFIWSDYVKISKRQ